MEQVPNETLNDPVEFQELDTTGFEELQKAFDAIEDLKKSGKLYEEETGDIIETNTPEEEISNEGEEYAEEEPEITTEQPEEDENELELQERKKNQKERQTLREQKRKTYAVIQEKRMMEERALAAEARVQELDQLLGHSLNSAVHHYSKTVYGNLEKAKQSKQDALDAGDSRQLIEADISLTKAINAVNELEKLENNEALSKSNNNSNYYPPQQTQTQYQPQYQQPQYNNNYPPAPPPRQQNNDLHREIANDWLETHPYLQPSSRNYNKALETDVHQFISKLDSELQNMGRMDQYYTDQYFDVIDKFIESKKYASNPRSDNRKASNEAHVGGVRNSYGGVTPSKSSASKQVTLTAEDRIMIENIPGMTKETYLKYKIQEMNLNKKKR